MTTFVDAHRSDFNFRAEFIAAAPLAGDILWRDAAGDDVLWLMNNTTPGTVTPLPRVTPEWHVKATGDFNGNLVIPDSNSNSDILWQNDNGALVLWLMNGGTILNVSTLPNPGPTWHVVGDNDFNADADNVRDDILFQNDNGALAMWTTTSTGAVAAMYAGTQNPGPTWHVVGTGDTDGDGIAGILWRNDSGGLVMWEDPFLFPGAPGGAPGDLQFLTVATLPTVNPTWHVKGMADFNHDGRADIVFQNDTGAVVVAEMGVGGTTIASANLININPGPAWHIVGLRDMDGDSHADILFQNDNGAAAVWEDYASLGGGVATFNTVAAITPNPNPNGHMWDLL